MADISDDEEIVGALLLMKDLQRNRNRKAPFTWIRDLYLERDEKGAYKQLIEEMKYRDREYYFRYATNFGCFHYLKF